MNTGEYCHLCGEHLFKQRVSLQERFFENIFLTREVFLQFCFVASLSFCCPGVSCPDGWHSFGGSCFKQLIKWVAKSSLSQLALWMLIIVPHWVSNWNPALGHWVSNWILGSRALDSYALTNWPFIYFQRDLMSTHVLNMICLHIEFPFSATTTSQHAEQTVRR